MAPIQVQGRVTNNSGKVSTPHKICAGSTSNKFWLLAATRRSAATTRRRSWTHTCLTAPLQTSSRQLMSKGARWRSCLPVAKGSQQIRLRRASLARASAKQREPPALDRSPNSQTEALCQSAERRVSSLIKVTEGILASMALLVKQAFPGVAHSRRT